VKACWRICRRGTSNCIFKSPEQPDFGVISEYIYGGDVISGGGVERGGIKVNSALEIPVLSGRHEGEARIDWCGSPCRRG